ncbi:DUF559 domain-containing protein [Corynebacterium tuberculostearicum]|uniref:DUF559 domain-containing protein n=1 Tax=Corynebacterium tuberculostearicum TaxID=38304 RepID=UPI0020274C4C|nr:DUF559 domain-containing protein [Corynebacterium tuberculostearicum]MCG7454100.1 endonuclease domain-containing protein [Corynebacterium tuberculostearicum]MCG7458262.1 endonuclease domain-containing protein [Corynebacterium tuberculostearicum]
MITDHFINLRYAGAESPHHLALQSGELTQIAPWIAVPTATWRQWVRHKQQFAKVAAAGWSTHRAVLISKSAARLWGIWVISREGEEVELAVPSGSVPPRRLTPKGYRYRRVKSLQESTVSIAGVRATNPARTCLEIARLHGFPDGLVATDSALGRHDVTTYDLREELAKMQRTRGQAAMRKVIEHAYGGSESPYESYLRALIIERFPQVKIEPQKSLLGKYRADLCLDGWLVVEVDGDAKYDGTYGEAPAYVVKQQIKRQRALENRGYVVLRFGPSDMKAPDDALRIIASHLEKRTRKVA